MRRLTYEEISKRRFAGLPGNEERLPVSLLLDNVRSLYNVGSIFRSADGARAAKLWLTGYTPFPPRKEIEKTALGATSSVPWEHVRDPVSAINSIRTSGAAICVLEQTNESRPYYTIEPSRFPLCIIVGNEITGVSPGLLAHVDFAIDIPMHGMKQSLNAAVAAGIVLYDCLRILKGTSAG